MNLNGLTVVEQRDAGAGFQQFHDPASAPVIRHDIGANEEFARTMCRGPLRGPTASSEEAAARSRDGSTFDLLSNAAYWMSHAPRSARRALKGRRRHSLAGRLDGVRYRARRHLRRPRRDSSEQLAHGYLASPVPRSICMSA
jgi:hypothetical protein